MDWKDLEFWKSGEWQVIEERYDVEAQQAHQTINPRRECLFAALDATPFETVRVAIIGQDPYPDPRLCTGVAFSIPEGIKRFPPTLSNIFKEYQTDLSIDIPPASGSLLRWTESGVLLWNAIPTCASHIPASHRDWTEWQYLTREIVTKLDEKGVVFVGLGSIAHSFLKDVNLLRSDLFMLSHPSPLGVRKGNCPFEGSRIFSRVNDVLVSRGKEKIEWKLP